MNAPYFFEQKGKGAVDYKGAGKGAVDYKGKAAGDYKGKGAGEHKGKGKGAGDDKGKGKGDGNDHGRIQLFNDDGTRPRVPRSVKAVCQALALARNEDIDSEYTFDGTSSDED